MSLNLGTPMTRRVKTTSAKAGTTAANRRVLAGATGVTAEPLVSSAGDLIEQNEIIHLLFRVGGTNPVFRVRIWWYSLISGEWHKGRQVAINASDVVTVEVNGLSRVYLQVETTPSGVAPTLDAWVALVRPV